MPYGQYIYTKSYDMAKSTMCAKSQSNHALPHWKYVLQCCAQCPSINITEQETDSNYPNPSTSICFQIYHLILSCTTHNRLLLTDKKSFRECQRDTSSEK